MSALEIIMICVSSVLFALIVIFLIFKNYFKKFRQTKTNDFQLLAPYTNHHKIIFLGDSLTDFYNISDFYNELPIYNRGIAGDRTSDVINRSHEIIEIKPQVIYLQIGINDLIKQKLTPQLLANRIIKVINCFPNIQLNLISLYPINRKKMLFSWAILRNAKNPIIVNTNQILQDYCRKHQIKYIDIYSHLIDKFGNLKSEYTIEGLHLSTKGYVVVTEVLKKEVITLINQNKQS